MLLELLTTLIYKIAMKIFALRLFLVLAFLLQIIAGATADLSGIIDNGVVYKDIRASDNGEKACCDHDRKESLGGPCSFDCKGLLGDWSASFVAGDATHVIVKTLWRLQQVAVIDLKPPIL